MNTPKLSKLGVGQKLIASFSVGLFILIISLITSTIILSNIDTARSTLTNSSIPALVAVNVMSTFAHNVIESSAQMSESKNIYELNMKRDRAFEFIFKLHNELALIKDEIMYIDIARDIENILDEFEINLHAEYEILTTITKDKYNYEFAFPKMRNALDSISEFTSIAKIDAKTELATQLIKLRKQEIHEDITINSIAYVDVISELISRTAELLKDLRALSETATKESVMSVQQEFDHSLRVITRAVVKHKELNLRNNLGPHILTLIKYGQDKPDIFDARLNMIVASNKVEEINDINFSLTKKLNSSVNLLSEIVKVSTEGTSKDLKKTILNSKYIFYIIAFISIILFLLLIWKFVYNGIVLRLFHISSAIKKLSGKNLDFEIDNSGHDEFSKIATALNTLKSMIKMRKNMHDELKVQSELLRRSNEDLSLFAYVASHDLQEPLRVISSYSQLLSKRYSSNLDDDADKFINYIVSSCSRMESLIEGLLSLSRIDTQELNNQSFWIEDILQDIKRDFRVKIDETFTLITWDEMPSIYADPIQVKTVFQNLIGNAMRYNQSNPPKIHISAEQKGEFFKFYVIDNGIGIDEVNHNKIFVIFKRLHSRNKYSGTGIGLSICKKIIERSGGEISVESKLNRGTTFMFTLPIDDRFRLDCTNNIAA